MPFVVTWKAFLNSSASVIETDESAPSASVSAKS